jgi:CubicO group peptidase (beta-lactamase class C family)
VRIFARILNRPQQGRIELDTPIGGKPFTPAQLLRHEAGLPDYGSVSAYRADVEAGRSPWTVQALMTAADADRLRYEPGRGWAYSNIGYWHITRLIEQASDRPLADALADLVFAPGQLSTARLAISPGDLTNVSMGDAVDYHPGWVYHGLIVGTALDAVRLLRQLLQGTLVAECTLRRMLQSRALPQFRSERYPDPAYGLGLMLRAKEPLDHPIGHTGSGPGSEIAVYGQRGAVCAVWVAVSTGLDPVRKAFQILRGSSE